MEKLNVVLDTNILIHEGVNFKAIDPSHQIILDKIIPDLERIKHGKDSIETRFAIAPTVAVELLFRGDTFDPDGMKLDLYWQYIQTIMRCDLSTLHSREFHGEGHSQLFQFNHTCEIMDLYNTLTRVRADFKVEFGVDIYSNSSEESRDLICQSIGLKVPNHVSQEFKLVVFNSVMRKVYLSNHLGSSGLTSINRLSMLLFIVCSIFNVLFKDKGKYPLSSYYLRHNFLCDYIVFHYGLVRSDCVILTADEALARRGNLIFNILEGPGVFLGVTKH